MATRPRGSTLAKRFELPATGLVPTLAPRRAGGP